MALISAASSRFSASIWMLGRVDSLILFTNASSISEMSGLAIPASA
jgi:hypothetical protein